jgi:ABC-type branched-subunit amino acid transport system substrate-binding protein
MGSSVNYLPMNLMKNGGAFTLALSDIIQDKDLLNGINLDYVVVNSDANNKKSLALVVNLVLNDNVSVVIGPAFSSSTEAVGLLTSEWNIPNIGYFSNSAIMSNKKVYDTYVRTTATKEQLSFALLNIVRKWLWKHTAILTPQIKGYWRSSELATETTFNAENITHSVIYYDTESNRGSFDVKNALNKLSRNARGKSLIFYMLVQKMSPIGTKYLAAHDSHTKHCTFHELPPEDG